MKKTIIFLTLLSALVLSACSRDLGTEGDGEGRVGLRVSYDATTRAAADEYGAQSIIRLYNGEGLLREYHGMESLPDEIWLRSGAYRVDVVVPPEEADGKAFFASYTRKEFAGTKSFTVEPGRLTEVAVECKMMSSILTVDMDDYIASRIFIFNFIIALDPDVLLDDNVDRQESEALVMAGFGSTSVYPEGYFRMPAGCDTLCWRFVALTMDDVDKPTFDHSGVLRGIKSGYHYKVHVKWTPGEGGLHFELLVDESTVDYDDTIAFERDPSSASTVDPYDVWAVRATVEGTLDETQYGSTGIRFGYRLKGAEAWSYTDAVRESAGRYHATLMGLTPSTDYEFCLATPAADGTQVVGEVRTLRTGDATPLPNGGMNEWSRAESSSYPSPFLAIEQKWWDSGNTASSMAQLLVLDQDAEQKVEGDYSARLQTVWIDIFGITKLAAGNLFSGEFVGIAGTQGGKVRFGRPFTGRPAKLRFAYRYQTSKLDKIVGAPAGETPTADDYDRCQVYVALGDWKPQSYDGDKTTGTDDCPVYVNTTMPETFFDPTASEVIAYGEYTASGTETPSEWRTVEIPLDYRTTRRMPTHIMVVCTSSKLGDYFTGSTDSRLWIDRMELVYE